MCSNSLQFWRPKSPNVLGAVAYMVIRYNGCAIHVHVLPGLCLFYEYGLTSMYCTYISIDLLYYIEGGFCHGGLTPAGGSVHGRDV